MSNRLAAVCLAAVLACGTGAAALAAPPAAADQPAPTVSVQDSLRLEARPLASAYEAGQIAVIEATATNTGSQTLSYWLSTPCATPFQVTVTTPSGQSIRLPRESELGKEPALCVQVIHPLHLAPGETVRERFAWDTASMQAGSYTVSAAFNAPSESDAPTTSVNFPLRIVAGNAGPADIAGHWAADSIRQAVQAGFVNGYPGGLFKPETQVTRAEFIKMLVVARGLPVKTAPAPSFSDVGAHWVETQGYLEAAVEAGFLHPEDYGGVLKPDERLTRQETAALVVRAMAQERRALMLNPDQVTFADKAEVNRWDSGFVVTASVEGIIKGYEDHTFRPTRPVTRAESVTMLLRMLAAVSVQVAPDAGLQVNGQPVNGQVAVMTKYGRYLAPLAELAEATSIRVLDGNDGWMTLVHGSRQVSIKAGVPYALDAAGTHQPLDVTPPVRIDGKLYVPEQLFFPLGLTGHWDEGARAILISTQ